jgi:DNA-binding beta-propeller fold protein YncE
VNRPSCRVSAVRVLRALGAALVLVAATPAGAAFVNFESGQVRPLALSPSGTRLFAVNTPDNRLEIFDVGAGGLTHTGSVSVGLEPVAVAARSDAEVWVVNHLSDSVSIVDVAATPPRVVATLLVGDEPRDIVLAGPGRTRAFITTARRGQNLPSSILPLLTTPSVPRALVWVFDATAPTLPPTIIELFGDTPRALAASPDGSRVYAAVFHSGNQTTTINEGAVCNDPAVDGVVPGPCNVFGVTMPGGLPLPETNIDGVKRPETGLIVRFDKGTGVWKDTLGRNWNNAVRFNLPDKDVFVIDANGTTPGQIPGPTGVFAGVGTVLYDMVIDPVVPGRVFVTNTEARNEVRFEGPGIFGGSTVRGHLHEARITVLDGTTVTPHHLNKHLDYDAVATPADKAKSLATPTGMAITADGATLYVAAFGSSQVGVFSTAALVADSFVPDAADHITVSGGGPSGLVLDEAHDRLYVFTRFDNAISVVDTTVGTVGAEIAHLPVYDPEPPVVRNGRSFLYDAVFTSANGEASCSSCHVFGDFDSLAWDLGNPDASVLNNPNPFRVNDLLGQSFPDHHPMKGPMTTQSLRGMANHGPMHWRGDRTGGNDPGGDPLDEVAAFEKFNVAFDGLIGRGGPIPDADMTAFANFILTVTYPPNPIRALDDSLTADQSAGKSFFQNSFPSDVFQSCNGCHVLNPGAGFFGSDGFSSFEFEPQLFKIPHLRNLYQKVGMFGLPAIPFVNQGDNDPKGDQVRGFGFLHDGSIDTVFRFHHATVFNQTNPGGFPVPNNGGFADGPAGDAQRRQVESFMLAFDSNLAPIVGQQETIAGTVDTGQLLAGKKLLIKDSPSDDEARRRIVVVTRDAPSAPAPDSAGDPRCGADPSGTVKARLRVASQMSGQSHETPLPCQNWELLGSTSAPRGYRYRDPELNDGTARRIVWKDGKLLRAVLSGAGPTVLTYDLQQSVQQLYIDVQLTSGPERLCLHCFDATGSGEKALATNGSCPVPSSCLDSPAGRLDLLRARAETLPPECDLVVKGTVAGEARGWVYQPGPGGGMRSDRASEPLLAEVDLRALALVPGQELTYTCVPPGSGTRIGVDRDEDGFFDRDELDAGSDPADPGSTP